MCMHVVWPGVIMHTASQPAATLLQHRPLSLHTYPTTTCKQAADHRVLIFSQFKIMLDVLEDYLQSRAFSFGRVDGSVTGDKRQVRIYLPTYVSDRGQAPGAYASVYFAAFANPGRISLLQWYILGSAV